jgi:orotidine-5'-phosphate decarboxylase
MTRRETKKAAIKPSALPVVFCAIDTPDLQIALRLSKSLARATGSVKLGLEFFNAQGPQGVRAVLQANPGLPLFLDLKYHDIPNTVAQAVRAVVPLGAAYINVHAAGGAAMMKAAREAADDEAAKRGMTPPRILAVTVLTSLSGDDLKQAGVSGSVESQVERLMETTLNSGLDGVVCSAHEIKKLRERFGPEPVLMVPGIRPAGHIKGSDDQARIMTPREAMDAGATHLVIGRPITGAPDPEEAARAILKEIND